MNAMPMMNMPMMNMPMMPMMMPMGGPMMTAMPMMCRCTMEMTKDGMVCKMMPMDPGAMEMMTERYSAMCGMMAMGMPMMMTCGGMPMVMCMMEK